ncbi:MAG: DUF3147 family protein [Deltaproteobacteria bacterium]|nr:DUF3147 family protein [Deltaproteobacteria bacterium]
MSHDTLFFIFKTIVSGLMIAGISSLVKVQPKWAAFLTALPVMTVLSLVWIYLEQKDLQVLQHYTKDVFLYVLPTLSFFGAAYYLFKHKTPFWLALSIALLILFLSVALFKKFGFLK